MSSVETLSTGVRLAAKSSGALGAATLPLFGGGAALLGGGVKSFAKVQQEHVGLRVHNGRVRASKDELWSRKKDGQLYGMVRPGLHVVMPFTHSLEVISTQNRNISLSPFMIMSALNRQHEVHAKVTWGIATERDKTGTAINYNVDYPELVYKAIMAARDPQELAESIGGICTESLRHILQGNSQPEQLSSKNVQQELVTDCRDELLYTYGAQIRRLNILSASYSLPDMMVNGQVSGESAPGQRPNVMRAMLASIVSQS